MVRTTYTFPPSIIKALFLSLANENMCTAHTRLSSRVQRTPSLPLLLKRVQGGIRQLKVPVKTLGGPEGCKS